MYPPSRGGSFTPPRLLRIVTKPSWYKSLERDSVIRQETNLRDYGKLRAGLAPCSPQLLELDSWVPEYKLARHSLLYGTSVPSTFAPGIVSSRKLHLILALPLWDFKFIVPSHRDEGTQLV